MLLTLLWHLLSHPRRESEGVSLSLKTLCRGNLVFGVTEC